MKTITLKLTGVSPLLMHSDRYANPLDPMTKAHKALTKKPASQKTTEYYEEVARSEWMGGLYYDENIGPYLPGQNIKSALVGAGKLSRMGAAFKRGVMILDDRIKLDYPGPRDAEKMFEDQKFIDCRSVVVGQSRIMRYRPKIHNWTLQVDVLFSPEMTEKESIIRAAEDAGKFVGLGDYRPEKGGTFGRFEVEVVK